MGARMTVEKKQFRLGSEDKKELEKSWKLMTKKFGRVFERLAK